MKKAWDSSNKNYVDPKAFVFSLVNKENKPFKVMCTNCAFAIDCYSDRGPSFGGGLDIKILSGSNNNQALSKRYRKGKFYTSWITSFPNT